MYAVSHLCSLSSVTSTAHLYMLVSRQSHISAVHLSGRLVEPPICYLYSASTGVSVPVRSICTDQLECMYMSTGVSVGVNGEAHQASQFCMCQHTYSPNLPTPTHQTCPHLLTKPTQTYSHLLTPTHTYSPTHQTYTPTLQTYPHLGFNPTYLPPKVPITLSLWWGYLQYEHHGEGSKLRWFYWLVLSGGRLWFMRWNEAGAISP